MNKNHLFVLFIVPIHYYFKIPKWCEYHLLQLRYHLSHILLIIKLVWLFFWFGRGRLCIFYNSNVFPLFNNGFDNRIRRRLYSNNVVHVHHFIKDYSCFSGLKDEHNSLGKCFWIFINNWRKSTGAITEGNQFVLQPKTYLYLQHFPHTLKKLRNSICHLYPHFTAYVFETFLIWLLALTYV